MSARPSYSASHLSELKAQTLSTPPGPGAGSYDDLTRSKFGSLALTGEAETEEDETHIPSTSAIQSAKDRRQLARKTGLDPVVLSNRTQTDDDGFISLSSTSVVPSGASKGGESRFVREDDELGEGEDEHAEYTGAGERVALGRKAGMAAQKKKREGMLELIDDAEMEDEDPQDEEDRAWEAEQIRRAGAQSRQNDVPESKPLYRPQPIPEASAIPTLNGVQTRLAAALQQARLSETEQAALADQLVREETDLVQKEDELRVAVERATTKEEWFSDLRTFVEDVGDFFRAKWSALEKVEADQRSILAERAAMVDKRRQADLSDDLSLWLDVAVPLELPKAEDKINGEDSDDEDTNMAETDVDELGRQRPEKDTSPSGPSRQARRRERLARRERRPAPATEEDGYLTDDELPPADAADLLSASASLVSATGALFADVGNEHFLSPTSNGGLSDRFSDWRRRYPEEYRNAFGGLALVQAWEFWARAEMAAGWNIWGVKGWARDEEGAKAGEEGLEGCEWMKGLQSYEHAASPEADDGTPALEDPEGLIGAMVTSVVVPLVAPLARTSYDPFSATATSRALQLVEQVSYVLDRHKSGAYETLVQAFLTRFQKSVTELRYLVNAALSPSLLAAKAMTPISGHREEARQRAIGRSVKLLKQGLRWKRFAKGVLLSSSEGALAGGSSLERLLGKELVAGTLLRLLADGPRTADVVRTAQTVSGSSPPPCRSSLTLPVAGVEDCAIRDARRVRRRPARSSRSVFRCRLTTL